MKLRAIINTATVKILLYLFDRGDARYSELIGDVIRSRSTLALALRNLQEEELVEREVIDTRPVQTRYSLTDDGEEIAEHLSVVRDLISKHSE